MLSTLVQAVRIWSMLMNWWPPSCASHLKQLLSITSPNRSLKPWLAQKKSFGNLQLILKSTIAPVITLGPSSRCLLGPYVFQAGGIIKWKQTSLVFHHSAKTDSLKKATNKAEIAAETDLVLYQIDAEAAFLHGEIDGIVYIAQPEGYVVHGRENEVCRLNKSIYGIGQASRIWFLSLQEALIAYGFVQSTTNPCVYHRCRADSFLIAACWVDDGLMAGSSDDIVISAVEHLNEIALTRLPSCQWW